jgi:hypothetical protein
VEIHLPPQTVFELKTFLVNRQNRKLGCLRELSSYGGKWPPTNNAALPGAAEIYGKSLIVSVLAGLLLNGRPFFHYLNLLYKWALRRNVNE